MTETVTGEPTLTRALKDLDPRLSLQFRPPFHVVVCQVNDQYAPVIATWMDIHGRPLPLSFGLLEKVKAARLDARNKALTVDEHNALRVAEVQKDRADAREALHDDHAPRIERGRVGVSMATIKKPRHWQREGAQPRSGAKR